MTPPTDAELEEIRKRSDAMPCDAWYPRLDQTGDIRRLLDEVQRLREENEKKIRALQQVIAHCGRLPGAKNDLLNGLLDSVDRIARSALTPFPSLAAQGREKQSQNLTR